MWERLERLVYVTEEQFGLKDYRKPILWFDKMLVVCGILAGIAGRILAGLWVLQVSLRPDGGWNWPLLGAAALFWAPGDYFCRTGNRGLIYHHMDLLARYLDGRLGHGR